MSSPATSVLALQGGGVLGYSQAIILTELERLAGRPCHEIFGMIGGTSVGSIVGAPLAIGVPASKIKDFFTVDAPKIFNGNFFNSICQLWDPKYSASMLESCLQELLGDAKLRDCKTKFIATAYDYASDRPVHFKSYEASWEDDVEIVIGYDSEIELWQVCRASSAAQTYFPAFHFNDSENGGTDMMLLDGGNTGDNAPDVLVLAEAMQFWPLHNIQMLSIGTGDSKWKVNADGMASPGLINAGIETCKIVFRAGEDAQVSKARKIMGGNHCRLNQQLTRDIAIDDASSDALHAQEVATNEVIMENTPILNRFSALPMVLH